MKKKILTVMMAVVFMMGCATVGPIPKEDIILLVPTSDGDMPVRMPKGHLDNPDNYYTMEEWEESCKECQEKKQE